ncbi:MAG: NAD(P)/FAD-dependent oxidoreductase [Chloroflexi bacterium]|nr:MAG: NAD(P)/FAD-dependent oxidoreductase [Chloroflexota bacterium]
MELHLEEGSRVCIVGGGPAGSFSALHLLHYARQKGIHLELLIFEPRDQSSLGSRGCKGCAGILSTRLLTGLAAVDVTLSKEVIQSELHSYAVHVDGDIIRIGQPDSSRKIVSVYRGGGPHHLPGERPSSFDRFLLDQACAQGAQHIQASVTKITNDKLPIVFTNREQYTADLVVLATGVSSNNPLSPAFGYRSPNTQVMVQDELLRPPTWPPDEVSVFLKQQRGVFFGVLTPKGRCLNVSLLGHKLTQDAVSRFIDSIEISPEQGGLEGLCGCAPRIATSSARHFFGDRWVAVGDAAVTRLYKDGIGSAFYTTKRAMRVVVFDGISKQAFKKDYLPYCKNIALDNAYGKLLFYLWEKTLNTPFLLNLWKRAVSSELELPPEQRIHMRILWGMLTGDELYKDLTRLFLKQPALRGLMRGVG